MILVEPFCIRSKEFCTTTEYYIQEHSLMNDIGLFEKYFFFFFNNELKISLLIKHFFRFKKEIQIAPLLGRKKMKLLSEQPNI